MTHKTTPRIEELASRLGVPRNTLYQWRRRGVPYRWRIALVQASGGDLQLSVFPEATNNGNDNHNGRA